MNENASRALDIWVGKPLCWVFTCLRRLGDAVRGRSVAGPPRKILFLKLAEMGAILLAVPAFEAARSRVGRENLYCAMLAGNRDVHELIDVFPLENLISIRDGNLFTMALDVARLMVRCRRAGIDTVIDLEGFARVSAVLSYLTGARTRVGLDRYTSEGPYRGDLFTHRVACNYYNHASIQFLTLVEALDASPDALPLHKARVQIKDTQLAPYRPSAAEAERVDAALVERCGGLPRGPRVILNPNLIDLLPLRRWPRERWLELGRRLLAEHPHVTLLLTGLPEEESASRELASEISEERAFSLAGATESLQDLVVLIGRTDLLITSDCGPAHMAALTPTPIVSIFGPETPRLYAPLSPRNLSLWAGLACSPCLTAFNHRKSPCQRNVCMEQITVDEVCDAVRRQCPALAEDR